MTEGATVLTVLSDFWWEELRVHCSVSAGAKIPIVPVEKSPPLAW